MNKKCWRCKKILDSNKFYKNKNKSLGLSPECKNCCAIYMKTYYLKNKEKIIERGLKYMKINGKTIRNKLKEITFNVYGNKCACCGENNFRFLTIDHINNDGYLETKSHRADICRMAIKMNFPKNLQLLCYNCNLGKARNNGICPHKTS